MDDTIRDGCKAVVRRFYGSHESDESDDRNLAMVNSDKISEIGERAEFL
jgi:hypothetical protein